jgi:hypothetical protein
MKKLMTLMLGLSLMMGSVSLFAADDKKDDTKKAAHKKKAGKKGHKDDMKKDGTK